jgi:hypothetical protein
LNDRESKIRVRVSRVSLLTLPKFLLLLPQESKSSMKFRAKRYERLMRAHGIYTNAASVKPTASQTTKTERPGPDTHPKSNKKRKVEDFIKESSPTDDNEDFNNNVLVKPDVKKEEANRVEKVGSKRPKRSIVLIAG